MPWLLEAKWKPQLKPIQSTEKETELGKTVGPFKTFPHQVSTASSSMSSEAELWFPCAGGRVWFDVFIVGKWARG